MADNRSMHEHEPFDVPRDALPRHVAIIMDGNGRWARQRGLPRIEGHRHGARAVRAAITECARLGISALTLYSFSTDNWKRPQAEVSGLMGLYAHYLVAERGEIMDNRIRVVHLGRREGLPPDVLAALDETVRLTASNRGLALCLALNYGSRNEIVDAVRKLAQRVARGEIAPEAIDAADISAELYTAGLPDPDLVLRTAGEMRLSDFLLWQISYAELYVSQVLWPDFSAAELHAALRAFAARERRYGNVGEAPASPRRQG